MRCKAFGGGLDDYIEGNDGRDILVGDFAFYDTSSTSRYPKLLLTINCSFGGEDTLYGGNGLVDYIVGGSGDDIIQADSSLSTNSSNLDVVFGDHAEILFYEDETHRLQQALTTDPGCGPGNDIITLGPGDDLVRFHYEIPSFANK